MSQTLSKYIATFDYFSKISNFLLSVTKGRISIASFATVTGAPVGLTNASFSLLFSINVITKILLRKNEKKQIRNTAKLFFK